MHSTEAGSSESNRMVYFKDLSWSINSVCLRSLFKS